MFAVAQSGCIIETWIDDPDEDFEPDLWFTETKYQEPIPQVDVLWVVDNTGSMVGEHAALEEAFPDFVRTLEDAQLGYQIGVITTDMEGQGGVLRGNPWIITPGLDDPEAAFERAIDVGDDSTAEEAGLAAMYAALNDPLKSGANRGFRRSDAALHVIAVSDSNDASDDWFSGNVLMTVSAFLKNEADSTQLPVIFSAVVGDSPFGCTGPRERQHPVFAMSSWRTEQGALLRASVKRI